MFEQRSLWHYIYPIQFEIIQTNAVHMVNCKNQASKKQRPCGIRIVNMGIELNFQLIRFKYCKLCFNPFIQAEFNIIKFDKSSKNYITIFFNLPFCKRTGLIETINEKIRIHLHFWQTDISKSKCTVRSYLLPSTHAFIVGDRSSWSPPTSSVTW